ncbi:hypothetical protein HZC31_01475 [Candidatus Woesearchaeota archaeon]|nr:hypothetical protein [Candidatus Woesearchaeota archaeon]
MKRGQISIFILLGLLLVLVTGFFVFYTQTKQEEIVTIREVSTTLSPLESYVESCMEQIGENALIFVPRQGGYFTTSGSSFRLGFYEIPHYYSPNGSNIPSLETVENELASYMLYYLPQCLDNFSSLTQQGYEITTQAPSATTVIGNDAVAFQLQYPITLSIAGTTATYDFFTVEIPSKLLLAHTVASEIVAAHDDATKMPLGELTEIGEKYEVYINAGNFNTTVIYRLDIPNEETQANEKFMFAVLYEWGDPFASQ